MPEEEAAIRKIENDRKAVWAVERAAKRAYKGPPLLTQKAIKTKNKRQMKLNLLNGQ